MKTITNNGIKYTITATDKNNEHQIERMVRRAVSACANYVNTVNEHVSLVDQYGALSVEVTEAQYKSEYESTIQCIGLFVEQPTSYIRNYIVCRAREEFGI